MEPALNNEDAKIIDGKAAAAALREELAAEVAQMDITPGLAVILVGDDPAVIAGHDLGVRAADQRV